MKKPENPEPIINEFEMCLNHMSMEDRNMIMSLIEDDIFQNYYTDLEMLFSDDFS